MLLALTSGLAWCFLQDQISKSAVAALTSLYGTKFQYGSIITTICKWVHGLCGWSWEEAQLAFHAQRSVPPGGGALIWEHGQEERP